MTAINIGKYRALVKPQVEAWIKAKGRQDLEVTLAELSIFTSCPIIAICVFMKELYGDVPGLEESLSSKLRFYRYAAVEG